MIRLLTAVLLFASLNAAAEVTLTPLNNNTPANADDVMGNFNALNAALPPSDCTTDQIIKWNGTGWECASRLVGAITMIDKWGADGESASTDNATFSQDDDPYVGLIRTSLNTMSYQEGSGNGDGFRFPENGIYKVEMTISLRVNLSSAPTNDNVKAEFFDGTRWRRMAYMSPFESLVSLDVATVYSTVTASFTLLVSDTNVERLRFVYYESNDGGLLGDGSTYSWVTFTRVEH
ncbi:MAG: hypothetical protein L7S57_11155 [Luminiphilus sp.]|nr:hypothetical protein [Luminiphilus sp.]